MQSTSEPEKRGASGLENRFKFSLDRLPTPFFAVLDGGCFEDLEDDLNDAGIGCRSLFLDGGDKEIRRDGPWFVELKSRAACEYIEALALEMPCAVFWSCPDGGQMLWRHLRTLNEILIPDQNMANSTRTDSKLIRYERVLFRHWDPSVLLNFLPVLTSEQLARFFGPAPAVVFSVGGEDSLKRAIRSKSLPHPSKGPLRLTIEQMERLEDVTREKSTRAIVEYLRETAPEILEDIDDAELYRQVGKARVSGNKLGLHMDEDLGDWAFLYLVSRGEVTLDRKLTGYIKSGAGGDRSDLKLSPAQRLRNAIETAAETEV